MCARGFGGFKKVCLIIVYNNNCNDMIHIKTTKTKICKEYNDMTYDKIVNNGHFTNNCHMWFPIQQGKKKCSL